MNTSANNQVIKILLVEDNLGDVRLIREALKDAFSGAFDLTCVERMSDAVTELGLNGEGVDVILLDLSLPDVTGIDTLIRMRTAALHLPIVILTGRNDEALALQAMHEGAQDYLLKLDLESVLLKRVLRYAIVRAQSDQAQRENEDRFRALVQHSNDIITILDVSGNVLFASPSAETIMGYSPAVALGLNMKDIIHPADLPSVLTGLINVVDRTIPAFSSEVRLRHADGSWRTLETTLTNLLDHPAIRGIVVNSRDVTDRKRIEAQVENQAKLFDQVSDAIIRLDMNGTIEFWNRGAQSLYGWAAEDVKGKLLIDVVKTQIVNDTLENVLCTVLETGTWNGEYLQTRQDGTSVSVFNATTLLRDAHGNPVGYVGINRDITERKRADESLRQSERLLRTILETLPIGVFITDAKGQINYANPSSHEIWGGVKYLGVEQYGEYKAWNTSNGRRIGADDWGAARAIANGETSLNEELKIERFDGELRYILNSAVPIQNSDGEIATVVVVNQDITERKQAENELASLYNASSFLFKADSFLNLGHQVVRAVIQEFQQTDCGLVLKEKNSGEFIQLARAGEYTVSTDAVPRYNRQGLIREALHTGQIIYTPDVTVEPRYYMNDPRTRSELVIPLKTANGTLGVLDLQSQDLDAFSQRDQRILNAFAERAAAAIEVMQLYEELNHHAGELEWRVSQRTAELQHAKEQVEAILNQSSDAIILAHSDTTIQQSNPAFYRLLGYTIDEALGQAMSDLSAPSDRAALLEALEMVIVTRESIRLEVVLCRKDGTTFDADMAISPVVQLENDDSKVICSIRDITARKRAEEELRRAWVKEKELNELKTRFVSMVSHDFRTPLASIQSSSDLLRNYSDRMSDERKQRHFDAIRGQIKHLTGLLEDMLTVTKAESVGLTFHPTVTDLGIFCQTIADEMQLIAGTRQIRFSINLPDEQVKIDPNLLRRSIVNLLSNAVKYSPEGSVVDFSVLSGNERIEISIKDQGIGIPEADQDHLFEVFHRANNVGEISGTGLGLAIVKRVVDAHEGTINVHSEVGVGSTFTIFLPLIRV